MKKYIIGGIIASILVLGGLYIANYFTCFGYYLPHRPAVIYVAPGDVSAHFYPEIITVPAGFNQTTVKVK